MLERPQRRRKTREADDGVQDDVGLRAIEQLGQVAAHLRQRREPVDRLRSGGSCHELELRMAPDDFDGLAADRSCGPEQGDALHLVEVYGRAPVLGSR